MMKKNDIRKQYLKKRKELSYDEYLSSEALIMEKFKSIDFSNVNYLHTFLPFKLNKEFDTFGLIKYIRDNHPDINIVIPKADFQTAVMLSLLYESGTILQENEIGISEPINGDVINPSKLDMVIVPLIGFDVNGNRVGYGKGFYDRFFVDCKPDVQKIGISFFDAIDSVDDINEYDVKLTSCISPNNFYHFE